MLPMSPKKNRQYIEKKMTLKDNHTWKAPKGYKIMVIDRGAVSFNMPEKWIIHKFEPLELHDALPPNDNARISVSLLPMPPGIDWTGLPLDALLIQATRGVHKDSVSKSPVVKADRTDIELVSTQHLFIDPKEKREAYSWIAIARGFGVHVLISFDFWLTDLAKSEPIWKEMMRSLQLGRRIEDPTKGPMLH